MRVLVLDPASEEKGCEELVMVDGEPDEVIA